MTDLFIKNGANVNQKDNLGYTPLIYTSINGTLSWISMRLDHKL